MRRALLVMAAMWAGTVGCNDVTVVRTYPGCGMGCSGGTITKIRVTRVDKVDLLLVVDNSPSMADKQAELARRMPELIAKLTNDTPDPRTGKPGNAADLHVGVITSSLGSHGSSACAPSRTSKANDDRGHLLPRAGEGGGTGWVVGTPTATPTSAPCPDGRGLGALGLRPGARPGGEVQGQGRQPRAADRHLLRRAVRWPGRVRLRGDVGVAVPLPHRPCAVREGRGQVHLRRRRRRVRQQRHRRRGQGRRAPCAARGLPPARLVRRRDHPLRRERRVAPPRRQELAPVDLQRGQDAAWLGSVRRRVGRPRAGQRGRARRQGLLLLLPGQQELELHQTVGHG